MKERVLSVVLSIVLALFAVSASIAVPILCRPFYYAQIDALSIPESTGWSKEVIREAFDDMMDYELKGTPFRTGQLKWSQSGYSHFADVKTLFWLDIDLAAGTAAALLVLWFLSRKWKTHRFLGFGPSFWAGIGMLIFFAVVGIAGAIDFDKAFTAFHSLFFPGKTNWLFDPATDEIILILPEEFFRNCAILAIGLIAAFVVIYLIAGRRKKKQLSQ